MTPREVVRMVLEDRKPSYVPWSYKFTVEPAEELQKHLGCDDLEKAVANHIVRLGSDIGFFELGFSLFERAWTLRGMEDLMIDMIEEPAFVHELLTAIADYNLAQAGEALKYDIDAVYFGDDWGQQQGLIMGYDRWKEFIHPQLKRMYERVRKAGKFVMIHLCGDVDELFDDLIAPGVLRVKVLKARLKAASDWDLFAEVLDGRNESLGDGVQRALGRPARSFAGYAKNAAAAGCWNQ